MLINCPECKREISDKSANCVHCGFPLFDSLDGNQLNKRESDKDKISIYTDDEIAITKIDVVYDGRSVYIKHINSVEVKKEEVGCILYGALAASVVFCLLGIATLPAGIIFVLPTLIFLLLFIYGIRKLQYIVYCTSSSGEINVYATTDGNRADAICNYIKTACNSVAI
jgi:hypothetical protein